MKNRFFVYAFLLLMLLFGWTAKASAQEQYLTFDETVHRIDSICKTYFINYELNREYLRQHPVPLSKWKTLEGKITSASPVRNWVPVSDSLGSFVGIRDISKDQRKRIDEMTDSLICNQLWNRGTLEGTFPLDDSHDLSYFIVFDRIDTPDKMFVYNSEIGVIDKTSQDTTWVKPKNHWYRRLSNPPAVYASVFDVEWDGHTYVVHEIFDVRTMFNRKEEKTQHTRACYQIK